MNLRTLWLLWLIDYFVKSQLIIMKLFQKKKRRSNKKNWKKKLFDCWENWWWFYSRPHFFFPIPCWATSGLFYSLSLTFCLVGDPNFRSTGERKNPLLISINYFTHTLLIVHIQYIGVDFFFQLCNTFYITLFGKN